MDPVPALDGERHKNENVTDYRYALVESDDMDIDKQHAIIRELGASSMFSAFGGKAACNC